MNEKEELFQRFTRPLQNHEPDISFDDRTRSNPSQNCTFRVSEADIEVPAQGFPEP